jgi:hypothetical protein
MYTSLHFLFRLSPFISDGLRRFDAEGTAIEQADHGIGMTGRFLLRLLFLL